MFFFWPILSNLLFGKVVGRATTIGVPSILAPYTMFGATASLVTTSAEDLLLFRVERVRLLPETYGEIAYTLAVICDFFFQMEF